jgi:hypothetical protein
MDLPIAARVWTGFIAGGGAGGPLAHDISSAAAPHIENIAAPNLDARCKKRLTFDESKREWIRPANARNVSSTGRAHSFSYKQ